MTDSASVGAFRGSALTRENDTRFSKVPEVTLGFWIIKILATTLGETGGDAVTMSLNAGYGVGTLIFLAIFLAAVAIQVRATRFNAYLYWLTIVATTTLGTTIADFVDRSLGVGYLGGSSILLIAVMASLVVWRLSEGTVSVNTVATPRVEAFYWVTILFSQTLGTALGDWVADTNNLGYSGGAFVFGAAIVLIATFYLFTRVSRVALFWGAFILTRPLGATLGDLLDKPLNHGGFAISRFGASVILAVLIIALIAALPQRAGAHPRPKTE
jgi:uncharacterized membrane-anchored protein